MYLFDPSAIKIAKLPSESDSSEDLSDEHAGNHTDADQSGDDSFSTEQVERFQRRFENGYDLYMDYVTWLQKNHPESLPDDLKPGSHGMDTIPGGDSPEDEGMGTFPGGNIPGDEGMGTFPGGNIPGDEGMGTFPGGNIPGDEGMGTNFSGDEGMDTFPDGDSPGDRGMATSHGDVGEESEDTFTSCEGISEEDGFGGRVHVGGMGAYLEMRAFLGKRVGKMRALLVG